MSQLDHLLNDDEEAKVEVAKLLLLAKRAIPNSEKDIYWKKEFGRLAISFSWRSPKNFMGRFGGGWNWNVGIVASRNTVLLHLLVCTLRFDVKPKETTNVV